jgi:hypothetical protein
MKHANGFSLLETALALVLLVPILFCARIVCSRLRIATAEQRILSEFPQLCQTVRLFCKKNTSLLNSSEGQIFEFVRNDCGDFTFKNVSPDLFSGNYIRISTTTVDMVLRCELHVGGSTREFLLSIE